MPVTLPANFRRCPRSDFSSHSIRTSNETLAPTRLHQIKLITTYMKTKPAKSIFVALFALCALLLPGVRAFGLTLPSLGQQDALNPRILESIYTNAPVSYGLIVFQNVPPGNSITNGPGYLGWCINSYLNVSPGGSYYPRIVSSYDNAGLAAVGIPSGPSNPPPFPTSADFSWNKINYILNNKPLGATASDIQVAIWYFIGGGGPSEAELKDPNHFLHAPPYNFPLVNSTMVLNIINAANANGDAYTPPPTGVTAVVTALPPDINVGTFQPFIIEVRNASGAIGDYVWNDTNRNGIQNAGEVGIDNVEVTLWDNNNNLLANTFTGPNPSTPSDHGWYQFTPLTSGTYVVKINNAQGALTGFTPTVVTAGSDRSVDSNPNPATVVLATDSSFDYTIDFGYYTTPAGRLGDFVWNDLNGNGIQDLNEPGINGVVVVLKDSTGLNTLATGTTAFNAALNVNGYYQFTGLIEGDYIVSIDNSQPALSGYVPTTDNAGTQANDSGPNPHFVNLPTSTSSDQTIDFGYKAKDGRFTLTKSVNKTTVNAFEKVQYTYTVTNTGATQLTGITIKDDNATPSYEGDDFYVVAPPGLTLLPGQSQSFVVDGIPPIITCAPINNVDTKVGLLITELLGNGNVKVTYRQSTDLVDNTYGSNASSGWTNGHTFSNFTGSDGANIQFISGTGTVVLQAKFDYISSTGTAAYPSGYGTLGATGGDGGMISGLLSDIVSVDTTMSKNLNQSPAFYGYTTNSPAPPSSFPTWDYVDGYTIEIKGSAFGSSGFGKVNIVGVHNSPAKVGANLVVPVPCTADAINKAKGTAVSGTTVLYAEATAKVTVTGTSGGGTPQKYTTYKQDSKGWDGATAGALLTANFSNLYPAGLTVGGTYTLKFTTAAAVKAFLPASGTPSKLTASGTNVTTSKAGELAGQTIALKLNVDFSNAGILKPGLAALKLNTTKLAGSTVLQVLDLANRVLGGETLPSGLSYADLNTAVKTINENYDQGTTDKGKLNP